MLKRIVYVVLCIVCVSVFASCRVQSSKDRYYIFYTNSAKDKLIQRRCEVSDESSKETIAGELLEQMSQKSVKKGDYVIKPDYVQITDYVVNGSLIDVFFSDSYNDMSSANEVLYRTAVVRTLTQIQGIEYVHFYVNKQEAVYKDGSAIGVMGAEDFVDDSDMIGDMEWATISIYYANKSGDRLIKSRTPIAYNKNVSIEKLVMDKLILGPTESGQYATIPKDTRLLSISVVDHVCYVNLSEEFINELVNVKSDVAVYSIVNSLCSIDGIHSVKILVNGDSSKNFRESISLDQTFSFNSNIVQQ